MQHAFEIGAALHQQLFGSPPALSPAFDLACYNEPALDIDGDFYSFTQFGPGCFEVFAGDVMGKGLGAALTAISINNAYRRILAEMLAAQPGPPPAPAALVNAIHATVTPQLIGADSFATLVLLRFDLTTQTLNWVNAGHTPTLLLPAGGYEVRELLGANLPLGVLSSESYSQHGARFAAGDSLLIYSDGVSEALDAGRNEFGVDRIKRILAGAGPASALQIIENLRREQREFTGMGEASDDRSVIVVRALPMAPRIF